MEKKIDDRPREDEGDSEADMFRDVINIIRAQRDRDARAKEGKPSEKGDRIGVYPSGLLHFYQGSVPLAERNDRDAESPIASIGAQIAAYRELGYPMAKPSRALQDRAASLRDVLNLIVNTPNDAPVGLIEAANRAVAAWMRGIGVGAQPWHAVLETCVAWDAAMAKGRATSDDPWIRATAADRVREILAALLRDAPEIPANFIEPEESGESARARWAKRVATAAAVLEGGKVVVRDTLTNRRKQITAWGRAVKFARAFGVTMPDKKSKVLRQPQTNRKKSKVSRRPPTSRKSH